MAKVSVIVPNYNHASYLNQRIESILNQSYQDFELILLDDCSTDNSSEILSSYISHPKVKHVIFNEKNSNSTFKQWLKGLELSEGEYIWIAESDDYCETTFLSTLVAALEGSPSAVLAFCGSTLLIDNAKFKPVDYSKLGAEANRAVAGKAFIQKHLIYENVILNASSVVFRKNNATKYISDILSYTYAGDWVLWLKLINDHDIYFCHDYLNYFRTSETGRQVNSKRFRSLTEGYKLYKNVISKYLPESSAEKEKALQDWQSKILVTPWLDWFSKEYTWKMLLYLFFNDPGLLKRYIICILLRSKDNLKRKA